MNPILRPRIPQCVRTLLTDIGPRHERQYHREEDDNETEGVTVDGIELPRRGDVDPGDLIAPAGLREEREEGDKGSRKQVRICGLCLSKPPCYTCPRCNVPYCGLACYRGSAHSACSEEFYKESVIRELRGRGETEEEGKRRMQEILLRLNREGEGKEEGIAEVLREMEEGEREMEEGEEGGALGNGDILALLSRLAEIQSTGGGNQGEIEDILTKLKEIGEKEAHGERDESVARLGDVEEGEEGEEQDLAERFSGLDIDSLSEDQLWALLPRQHKERFEGLVKGGAIGGLVPLWSSWWERHEGEEGALIELLEGEEDGEEEHKRNWKEVDGDSAKGGEEEKGEKGSLRERNKERVSAGGEERRGAHTWERRGGSIGKG
ncbi:hypothetical protein AAFF_G00200350 [Aldrovandia affinis]|uniref:HIT-type domain-containing protein n=1 Tax=Aldrovandia affinis TaxID=143900 RepID=A0AAD7W5Y2_9TELE|nr:hypothetical protein AAFF_G00200350 [Aldrovandia affinis]